MSTVQSMEGVAAYSKGVNKTIPPAVGYKTQEKIAFEARKRALDALPISVDNTSGDLLQWFQILEQRVTDLERRLENYNQTAEVEI